jgi:hypothetical protein
MTAVSTEGRIHVSQLTRDLNVRERVGADVLSPGCKLWKPAFIALAERVGKIGSPVKAARAFKAGLARLLVVEKAAEACFINSSITRGRSGGFEVLTWEVDHHPLINSGHAGVVVRHYYCTLRRNGQIWLACSNLAFCSWHSLARMAERSRLDIFASRGVVIGCGLTGLIMRESEKHANTAIGYAADDLLCAGVLRVIDEPEDGKGHAFFDVLTAYQPNEIGPQVAKWKQGCAIAVAVREYLQSDEANPDGWADDIAVLVARNDDFVSNQLRRV